MRATFTDNVFTGRTFVYEPSPEYVEGLMSALRRSGDALCYLMPRMYGPIRVSRHWRGKTFNYYRHK